MPQDPMCRNAQLGVQRKDVPCTTCKSIQMVTRL